MRRPLIYLLLSSVSFICTPSFAARITVDPNSPVAHLSSEQIPQTVVDTRLNQKITYTATGKRLQAVLEEISDISGVGVNCGINRSDWRVRDLPLVVIVKDISLGKLLRTIADSTHLLLSSYKAKDKLIYRIWRDKSRKKQLDDYFQNQRNTKLAQINWEWDAWVKLGQMPEPDIRNRLSKQTAGKPAEMEKIISTAKLMTLLPNDTRERMLGV